jgi:hypothetical protein
MIVVLHSGNHFFAIGDSGATTRDASEVSFFLPLE